MTGADFIAECLSQEGVTKVFGQCGHTNLALIDALPRVGIDFVSFRHEQLAAHAADAYSRVSHKLAVVLVHLSPGLTNALTGVVTAAADLTPMIVISGNTPSYNHARDAHQCIRFQADASQGDIFRPFCKRVWRVDDPQLLTDVLPRALNLAQSGRPGAVLIDVSMDVFSRSVKGSVPLVRNRRPGPHRIPGADAVIGEAADLILGAARPVIFAGNRVHLSEAWNELKELAEYAGVPVATSLMGKGAFPEDHPLSVGMAGIWGTRVANETTRNADVILAIGTGFGEADCSSWNPQHTFAIPVASDPDRRRAGSRSARRTRWTLASSATRRQAWRRCSIASGLGLRSSAGVSRGDTRSWRRRSRRGEASWSPASETGGSPSIPPGCCSS